MPRLHDYDRIDALWSEWQSKARLRPDLSSITVLHDILRHRGTALSEQEVSFALGGPDHPAPLDSARFTDCMVALLGDPALRLRHAFAGFDADDAGTIAKDALLAAILVFGVEPEEARLLVDEIDADGDGRIGLDDLTLYLAEAPPAGAQSYRASHLPADQIGAAPHRAAVAAAPTGPRPTSVSDSGLTPRDLRIGFFRLMQGAAYRSFRANYAANSETHLRARDLPYTIDDFARFITATIDYYLSLGIVTGPACIAEFRRLDTLVQDEVARLHARIAGWHGVDKAPAMLAAQGTIDMERSGLDRRRNLCRAVIEGVLSLRMQGFGLDRAGVDALALHEIGRLRHAELRAEAVRATPAAPPTADYLESWNRVILSVADARVDGAIMPVRFWYDTFMPQLLLCASILTDADLYRARDMTARDLDDWHGGLTAQGAFERFATDLRDGFAACSLAVKLSLQQAWSLTEPYLSGVEKRRERAEFGRDSGYLSEYVAFVDLHLGRHDVATSDMRLSFPYYIGPAVWGLLHGSAELIEAMPPSARASAVEGFITFFRSFATMYPCPYCRYHLNRYVIRNREVEMYPVEFLLLGRARGAYDMAITLDAKLATVTAPGGLRTFLWMLHNAVSSSIARTEPWYHRQPKPLYTSRFWPGIEAEMARAAAHGHTSVAIGRVNAIYAITKPAAHLAVLRDELGHAVRAGETDAIALTIERADGAIADLTQAMADTGWLTRTYALGQETSDRVAPVDAVAAAFAISGMFVER